MRAYSTRVVIDIDTLEILERDWIAWDGPWDECKGGNTKSETARANQITSQELGNQTTALGQQQQATNMVNPSLQSIIQNQGMLPQLQAAMTSQAMNSLPQQYQQLYGNLSNTLTARGITGGQNAGAGALAQSFGMLGAQEAGQQSQLLNQIQLAKGQNLNNALGMAMGEGQMYGNQALGFGNTAANTLGTGMQGSIAQDQMQTALMGSLIGGLTNMGGSFATGGLSTLLKK